jgi:hypothetical protein
MKALAVALSSCLVISTRFRKAPPSKSNILSRDLISSHHPLNANEVLINLVTHFLQSFECKSPLTMSTALSRAVLRRSAKLPVGRTAARFESTASKATEAANDTASKASQRASEFKSKASEGLSRVSSAAGPAISGAAKGLGNALGKVGGRTGRLIAFIERE